MQYYYMFISILFISDIMKFNSMLGPMMGMEFPDDGVPRISDIESNMDTSMLQKVQLVVGATVLAPCVFGKTASHSIQNNNILYCK